MQRSRFRGSALLTIVLVLTASASVASADPVVPQANWGSCTQFTVRAADLPTARCTMLAVGSGAELAVIRIPAEGVRLGSLFVNPGGPGASAVDAVAGMGAALTGSPINEHFDLIGFDPRGVGHSTPQLRCRTNREFDQWRTEPMVDFSPAGVARIEGQYQQFAQRCAERMGTDFLATVGTATVAKDMDAVRRLIGDDQINYLGFSYGTQIGTAYVDEFGEHVRAMVLDGAIDPAIGPIEKSVRQMAAFQAVFDDYAADCARSTDCPLGQDPDKWADRYHALIDPLVSRPGRTSDPRGLSYADAITGTFNALYTQAYWKYLTSGLLGLARGTDAGDLLALADEYQGRRADGSYLNLQDAFNAVRCVDAPSPTDPAAWVEADRRIRHVAPFASYGEFTGYAPRDICAFWPVPATSQVAAATPAARGKVVVVSTTHDPATPYQSGVDLARQLQAPMITFEGTQHTVVFNGHECVDTAVVDYFVDGTVPGDIRC
jgi:pimeloyl-ACP methyl ester carboxylesterase